MPYRNSTEMILHVFWRMLRMYLFADGVGKNIFYMVHCIHAELMIALEKLRLICIDCVLLCLNLFSKYILFIL